MLKTAKLGQNKQENNLSEAKVEVLELTSIPIKIAFCIVTAPERVKISKQITKTINYVWIKWGEKKTVWHQHGEKDIDAVPRWLWIPSSSHTENGYV